ncbi:MAG: carbohydrate ABC transporter permease [Ruminococcaceae bacterium]|nr:carbohydrate ABC transporter permease [Oscillospiraceae bacterium]
MGAFLFLPMYYTVIQSLKPLDELWMFPPRFYVSNPSFENFSELLYLMSDSWVPFSRYIFNTVFISVTGTFGNLLFASLCAYALAKIKFPGRGWMFQVVVLSLMFHSTVSAIANYITLGTLGWLDTYLARVVPAWGSTLGLYLMKQFMETNVHDSILESARIDGAKEFKIYWTIAMPMVKPAWLTLIVYCFKDLWNTGASIYIQSEQLKTFNYAVSQLVADGISRQGASAAAAVITMLVPIIVFILTQSNILETMGSSGMKD